MSRNRMKLRIQVSKYYAPRDVWEQALQTVVEIVNASTIKIWREDHDLLYTAGPWVVFGVSPDSPRWRVRERDWKELQKRLQPHNEEGESDGRSV